MKYTRRFFVSSTLAASLLNPVDGFAYQQGNMRLKRHSLIPSLAPSTQWNGTAGSGFGGSFPAAPVDPTRVTAKPVVTPLFAPLQTIGSDLILGVFCYANGLNGTLVGIKEVKVWLEGRSAIIPVPTKCVRPTVVAGTKYTRAYNFKINWTTAKAIASGGAYLYFEVTTNDPTMQKRVVQVRINIAANGFGRTWVSHPEGGPAIYDGVYNFGPGEAFSTWDLAVNRAIVNDGRIAPLIYGTTTGNYALPKVVSGAQILNATSWVTTASPSSVQLTFGNGTDFDATTHCQVPKIDGLRFVKCNFDVALMTSTFGNAIAAGSGSAGNIWFDGCNVTCTGYPVDPTFGIPYGNSGTGSRAFFKGRPSQLTWLGGYPRAFFTDTAIYQISGDAIGSAALFVGSSIDQCAGSGLADVQPGAAAQDFTINKIGGYWSGIADWTPAMTISYTGTAVAAAFEKTGLAGATGSFNGYLGFTATCASTSMTVISASAEVPLTIGTAIYFPASKRTRTITGGPGGGAGAYTISGSETVTVAAIQFAKAYSTSIVTNGNGLGFAPTNLQNTMPRDICNVVNTWGGVGAWSATPDPNCPRAAIFLSLPTLNSSDPIPPTKMTAGANQIYAHVDDHGDAIPMSIRYSQTQKFNGFISDGAGGPGNILTVSSLIGTPGTGVVVGNLVSLDNGVTTITYVTALGSGTGQTGTYTVSGSPQLTPSGVMYTVQATPYENCSITYGAITNVVQTAAISSGKNHVDPTVPNYKWDVIFSNITIQDTSNDLSVPPQPNYVQGPISNYAWEYMSFYGSVSFFGTDFVADGYCTFNHVSFEQLTYANGIAQTMPITLCSFRFASPLPADIGATNSVNQGGALDSTIYTNAAINNFLPVNVGGSRPYNLVLPYDGSIAGALNTDGTDAGTYYIPVS